MPLPEARLAPRRAIAAADVAGRHGLRRFRQRSDRPRVRPHHRRPARSSSARGCPVIRRCRSHRRVTGVGLQPVQARNYMVVSANPLASQAGCDVLKRGGSAVDAAVATQAVLGLVEPQSSGLGGGAFMLHYNASTKVLQTYDGREQAPAAATENYLRQISATNTAYPLPAPATATTDGQAFAGIRASGRSIGTPGLGAHARTGAAGARQARLARSVRIGDQARQRRLPHQRSAGRCDRRQPQLAAGRCRRHRLLPRRRPPSTPPSRSARC